MAERILLVTGSRALAGTALATAWARERIAEALTGYAATRIVAGDARGADAFARSLAYERGLPFECWHLDELVRVWLSPDESRVVRRWWPVGSGRLSTGEWPLSRNAAMVASVAARAANRDTAQVLGLIAPWARNGGRIGGTRQTIRCAEKAGIWVLPVLQCPADLGPREVRGG